MGEERTFKMLREQAREGNRSVVDVAAAVIDGHALLPGRPVEGSEARPQSRCR